MLEAGETIHPRADARRDRADACEADGQWTPAAVLAQPRIAPYEYPVQVVMNRRGDGRMPGCP